MDTIRVSRVLRRAMIPVAVLLGFLLWWSYGTLTVPPGMDTLTEDYPPGTVCVIDKRPGVPAPGQVVFFEIGGGMLLSRVARVDGERFWIEHEEGSRFTQGDELGPIAADAIRALVLTGFRSNRGEPVRERR